MPLHPMRSILFAPANLPDLIRKMPRAAPDIAVACLEDGTPPAEKEGARAIAAGAIEALRSEGWTGRMFARINDVTTPWFEDDVRSVLTAPFDGIVLPMVSSPADVKRLSARVAQFTNDAVPLVLGIETVAGVINVGAIMDAAPSAVAIYFGGEDYATSLGAARSESNIELLYPRSQVAMHARLRDLGSFDHGTVRFDDDERFRRECQSGRGLGFTGKICFHPRQVAHANELFRPSEEELAWSRRVLAAYEEALRMGRAAPAIDGQMIDGPLVTRARETISAAAGK